MRIPPRLRAPLAVIVVLSACTEPASKVPASPSGPDTVSVTIDGPSTIAPGQSAQLTAIMRLSDGTTKTAVSPGVTWRSSSGVLTVSTSGLATARTFSGDSVVTADVPRLTTNSVRTASREIVVVPDGTFRIVGMVTDEEFPTAPVLNARVQITPGPVFTTTDATGRYKLYGVPPTAQLLVTADGYQTLTDTGPFTANSTRNYQLKLSGQRLNLAGNYRLAIDFAGACGSTPALNNDLQHRRYDAVISQNGSALEVMLTEPIFRINPTSRGNHFTGVAGAAGATFTLDGYGFYYYYYGPTGYPNVVERLANGSFLVVDGRATTTLSGGTLAGPLNGGMWNWDSRFPTSAFFLGGCFSSTIQFSLTPR